MPLLPANIRAILWMTVSCVAFAGLWVLIRVASEELHPFAIVVWRNLIGLIWLLLQIRRAQFEESVLRQTFREYEDYARRVPMLIPGVRLPFLDGPYLKPDTDAR